jgi:hypothetical protein
VRLVRLHVLTDGKRGGRKRAAAATGMGRGGLVFGFERKKLLLLFFFAPKSLPKRVSVNFVQKKGFRSCHCTEPLTLPTRTLLSNERPPRLCHSHRNPVAPRSIIGVRGRGG